MQLAQKIAGEYGSDRNGLVWGFAFRAGQSAKTVTSDEAATLLAAGGKGERASDSQRDTFFWLHFSLANAATERWLQQHCQLPEAFFTYLHTQGGSTRVEQEDDALLGVVNDVLFDFQHDVSDVATMSLCVQPDIMVTARLKPLRSIDRLRESVKAGSACQSPCDLLAQLLQNQANVLVEIVRQSSIKVDDIEDEVLVNRVLGKRAELSALRRLLVRLQRLLAPEPAAFFRLLNRPPSWITEDEAQDLRQSAEEFASVVTECAALVDRMKLIQEELFDTITEQNNRSLFLLTFVTVVLLPFNVVGGLFGMNVGGIPFATDSAGFWVIITVVTLLTSGVVWLLLQQFRR